MKRVGLAVATVGGVGYAPVAPGTFGSAAGLLVWWLLPASPVVQGVVIVAIFIAGSWGGNVAEHHFGRTDPGQVVIDEVMGMLITLFSTRSWVGALVLPLSCGRRDQTYPANRLQQLRRRRRDGRRCDGGGVPVALLPALGNRVIW
jgi:hypothetical protein